MMGPSEVLSSFSVNNKNQCIDYHQKTEKYRNICFSYIAHNVSKTYDFCQWSLVVDCEAYECKDM